MITDELLNVFLTESNHYYQQHIRGQENKTQQPDISVDEIYHLLALIILMGHDVWDTTLTLAYIQKV